MGKQQISISFKNNEKDTKTYQVILALDDRAVEVKAVLYEYFVLGHRFIDNNQAISFRKLERNEGVGKGIIHNENSLNDYEFDEEDSPDVLNF